MTRGQYARYVLARIAEASAVALGAALLALALQRAGVLSPLGFAPAPSAQAPEMADGTVVYEDPPAPIVEYVPAAPYPDYVWVGGFWGWSGAWVWHAGHYGPRPFRGASWAAGGWVRASRGWAWHGGRWR